TRTALTAKPTSAPPDPAARGSAQTATEPMLTSTSSQVWAVARVARGTATQPPAAPIDPHHRREGNPARGTDSVVFSPPRPATRPAARLPVATPIATGPAVALAPASPDHTSTPCSRTAKASDRTAGGPAP